MRKIILMISLIIITVSVGSGIYIENKQQRASVYTDPNFQDGILNTRNFQKGETVKFTLISNYPIPANTLYGELLPTFAEGKTVYLDIQQENFGSTNTVYSTRVPVDTVVGTYEFRVGDGSAGSQISWHFDGTVEVTNEKELVKTGELSATENEAQVTGFSISATQPDVKNPSIYKVTWSGAGRGIAFNTLKGAGSKTIKQLSYQNLFPIEDSGYKDILPFFSIPNDGIGDAGEGDIRLINPTSKTQEIEIVVSPKGLDGSPSATFAKSMTLKVEPSAPKIVSLDKNKNKLKAGEVVTATLKSYIPIAQLAGPLRIVPNTELRIGKIQKKNMTSQLIESPKFTMENTMTFMLPADLAPGKYRLTLKTPLGASTYDVVLVN